MRRKYLLLLLFPLLMSCGTSQVIVSGGSADIYADGIKIGYNQAEVKRTGLPKKIHFEAKVNGATVGSITAKRKIDELSCLVGYFTYGLATLFLFRFPETIVIPVAAPVQPPRPQDNIWMRPPSGW